MNCDWIKIYDAPDGGNLLDPNVLYNEETIYIDISEMPDIYSFIGWKDINGNFLGEDVIKQVDGGRYMTNAACNGSFVAYLKTKSDKVCLVVVDCNSNQGSVYRSQGYDICGNTITIGATPNCCNTFTTWSDQSADRTDAVRNVTVFEGANTYTASFTAKDFNITVGVNDDNMGNASTTMNTVHCGDTFTISATPNEGYKFEYWYPDDNTTATRTIQFNCENPTVYRAVFSKIQTYSLTFDYDYPECPSPKYWGQYVNNQALTLPDENAFTRNGHFLIGWAKETGASGTDYEPGETTVFDFEENTTLYAVWGEYEHYRVAYYGTPSDPTYQYPTEDVHLPYETFTLYEPENIPGYIFQGWRIVESGETPSGNENPRMGAYTMTRGNFDAYAVWSREDETPLYKITYRYNDGNNTNTIIGGIVGGSNVTLPSDSDLGIIYANHQFSYWNYNGQTYYAGNTFPMGTSDVILIAVWSEDETVTLNYDVTSADSGETPEDQTCYIGETLTLDDGTNIGKTGYEFNGWAMTSTAAAPQYYGNQTILPQTSFTLYPVWVKVPSYRVNYYVSDGCTAVVDSTEYSKNGSAIIKSCGCTTESGCTCSGWNTLQDGTGTTYTGSETITVTDNVDLFQMWDCCNVTFISSTQGTTLEIDGNDVDWGVTVDMNKTPEPTFDVTVPSSCCFEGWLDINSGSYINSCDGEPEGVKYKLIPSDYISKINPQLIVGMSDEDFISEIETQESFSPTTPFIRNNDTGEVRQGVYYCSTESYDLTDGMVLMAMVNCGTYEESQDEHAYILYDSKNYVSLYEYLKKHMGETPETPYVAIRINGVEQNYIYTTCNNL